MWDRGLGGSPWKGAEQNREKLSVFSAELAMGWGEFWVMEGNEGGLRQAGWPGPLLADGGKRHLGLSLWMLSSSAIVWQVQEQTHALGVSLATRNRNKLPSHPTRTAHIHVPIRPLEPLGIPGLHKHACHHPQRENSHRRGAQAKQSVVCPHTPDLKDIGRVRGQTNGDTHRSWSLCIHKNWMQSSLVQCFLHDRGH